MGPSFFISALTGQLNSSSTFQLLVTVKVVPSLPIFVTLMMELIRFPRNVGSTRATRPHITEDGILHRHRSENLKSYIESLSYLIIKVSNCVQVTPAAWIRQLVFKLLVRLPQDVPMR
jgi:hypothetical protein